MFYFYYSVDFEFKIVLASWFPSKEAYRLNGEGVYAVLSHWEKTQENIDPCGEMRRRPGTPGIIQYDAVHYHSDDKHPHRSVYIL